jgi:superfamily II DNA or RNA helicase
MEFIYVINVCPDSSVRSFKIGSTKFPLNRLRAYKTSYFSKDNTVLEYKQIYKIIDACCYEVDENLKKDSTRGFMRFCESPVFSNVGTEIYDIFSCDLLEMWFIKNGLKYEPFDMARYTTEEDSYEFGQEEARKTLRRQKEEHQASRITLRGYQVEIYTRMVKHLKTNMACVAEIFCGGGKTVLYQKYIQDYASQYSYCVIVVPTLNLIGDMVARWALLLRQLGMKSLQIGSHGDGTTDTEQITQFLRKNQRGFIFSTYASVGRFIEAMDGASNILMIFDECHKCCAFKKHESVLYKLYTAANGWQCIKNIIFATATPKYYLGSESMGMNHTEYFGEFICNIPMARLIRENFLCPYKIIVRRESTDLGGDVNYYNASINILKRYLYDGNYLSKILIYTSKIATIDILYNKICSDEFFQNDVKVFKAYSGMKEGIDTVKRDFIESKETAIMINCRLFTEGINIPELDAVVFCDPKNSPADIIQCFGRALRYNPADPNKIAKIFIPIVDSSDAKFGNLLSVIDAISAHDPKLRDEVAEHFAGNKRTGSRSGSIIDINITEEDYKILDAKVEAVKITTMNDAIMYVLRDHVPRTYSKIWQEISDRELYTSIGKTPWASCGAACGNLYKQGKLSRENSDGIYRYFIIAVTRRMTTKEFIQTLRENLIETESEYRVFYEDNYCDEYPINPCEKYKGFSWKHLAKISKFYTLDECIARVRQLEPVFVYEHRGLTDLEKNKLLHILDNKIPKDMHAHYEKKLNLINDNIFKPLRR